SSPARSNFTSSISIPRTRRSCGGNTTFSSDSGVAWPGEQPGQATPESEENVVFPPHERRVRGIEMLEVKLLRAGEECLRHRAIFLARTAPFQMRNRVTAIVYDAESPEIAAQAEIEVIAIHEELLVKNSDPREDAARGHDERSVDRADWVGFVLRQI